MKIFIQLVTRCVRLEAALRRMISVWHHSTARAIVSALLLLSRYFMSHTDYSAQRRFKSNTPKDLFKVFWWGQFDGLGRTSFSP